MSSALPEARFIDAETGRAVFHGGQPQMLVNYGHLGTLMVWLILIWPQLLMFSGTDASI